MKDKNIVIFLIGLIFLSVHADEGISVILKGEYDCVFTIDDDTARGTMTITERKDEGITFKTDIPVKLKSRYILKYDNANRCLRMTTIAEGNFFDYMFSYLMDNLIPTSIGEGQTEFTMLKIGENWDLTDFIKKEENSNKIILISDPSLKSSNNTVKEHVEIEYAKKENSYHLQKAVAQKKCLSSEKKYEPAMLLRIELRRKEE